jgi:hypothetical protein
VKGRPGKVKGGLGRVSGRCPSLDAKNINSTRVASTRRYIEHLRSAVQPFLNPGAVLTLDTMFEGVGTATATSATESARRVSIKQEGQVKPVLQPSTQKITEEHASNQQTAPRARFLGESRTCQPGPEQQNIGRYTKPPRGGRSANEDTIPPAVPIQPVALIQHPTPQRLMSVQSILSSTTSYFPHTNLPEAPSAHSVVDGPKPTSRPVTHNTDHPQVLPSLPGTNAQVDYSQYTGQYAKQEGSRMKGSDYKTRAAKRLRFSNNCGD